MVFLVAMVSETLAKVRTEQGCHGHLGGAFGDFEEAKKAGARMGGDFCKKIYALRLDSLQ